MRISSFVAALAASLALGGAAYADGLPSKYTAPMDSYVPVHSWTGLYAGISGGVALSAPKFSDSYGDVCYGYATCNDAQDVGGLFGGTLGYNWQVRKMVLGLEGDISWAGLNAESKTYVEPGDPYGMKSKISAIATLRARVGYAVDSNLFYITGGLAFVNAKHEVNNESGCDGYYSPCDSGWQTGFTVGGGLEAMLTDRLSFKGEYLYIGMPTDKLRNTYETDETYGFVDNVQIFRVGLNYKLGSGCCDYMPLK